jgi:hypothetical protein
MIPFLNEKSVVVFVGSQMGSSSKLNSKDDRDTLFKNDVSRSDLLAVANRMVTDLKAKAYTGLSTPAISYSLSKLIINLYPKVQSFLNYLISFNSIYISL